MCHRLSRLYTHICIYCHIYISVIIVILKEIIDLGRGTKELEWGETSGKDKGTMFMYEIL